MKRFEPLREKKCPSQEMLLNSVEEGHSSTKYTRFLLFWVSNNPSKFRNGVSCTILYCVLFLENLRGEGSVFEGGTLQWVYQMGGG